jgi:hypothetical protein
LVFSTSRGTSCDRRNLLNRELKLTCKKLGLVGVNWHWLRHANATLPDAVGTVLGAVQSLLLSGHPKTGQRWSGQNRPTGRGCFILPPPAAASLLVYFRTPTLRTAFEYMTVMEKAIRAWR